MRMRAAEDGAVQQAVDRAVVEIGCFAAHLGRAVQADLPLADIAAADMALDRRVAHRSCLMLRAAAFTASTILP